MRILILHNKYQLRGGEDAVVESEIELLRSRGHDVMIYTRDNIDINQYSRTSLAINTVWSRSSADQVGLLMDQWGPKVVHAHNTFPLISPSVYWAAATRGIAVVQTLHNFRLLCPQAMFLRNDEVCESCLGRMPLRGIIHACYRDSYLQSTLVAGMITFHRWINTYRDKITRFIALNEFCRQKFIDGGLPSDRIVVKPNFVDSHYQPQYGNRAGFLFVGRLSREKGLNVLATAASIMQECKIKVVGSGPDSNILDGFKNIERMGSLNADQVFKSMSGATALILPSIWYENFPRTLVEAFAAGLPVIASRIGALPELIEDGITGILFDPGNALDLASKLKWAAGHPGELAQMGVAARKYYETHLTPARNYELLMSIYDDAANAVVN